MAIPISEAAIGIKPHQRKSPPLHDLGSGGEGGSFRFAIVSDATPAV